MKHVSILSKLTNILNKPVTHLRMGSTSASINSTLPAVLRTTEHTHKRKIRAKNPYQNFFDKQTATKHKQQQKNNTTHTSKISNNTLNKVIKTQLKANT